MWGLQLSQIKNWLENILFFWNFSVSFSCLFVMFTAPTVNHKRNIYTSLQIWKWQPLFNMSLSPMSPSWKKLPRFAVLCSTNWCRYCPSAVKLFERLQNEQEDIELMVLKDMENTLFKQLSVTSYPTFIAFENGQQLYKGTSQIEFCNVFQIAHERKILQRPDGSNYIDAAEPSWWRGDPTGAQNPWKNPHG